MIFLKYVPLISHSLGTHCTINFRFFSELRLFQGTPGLHRSSCYWPDSRVCTAHCRWKAHRCLQTPLSAIRTRGREANKKVITSSQHWQLYFLNVYPATAINHSAKQGYEIEICLHYVLFLNAMDLNVTVCLLQIDVLHKCSCQWDWIDILFILYIIFFLLFDLIICKFLLVLCCLRKCVFVNLTENMLLFYEIFNRLERWI